jgi:hypothetical protein
MGEARPGRLALVGRIRGRSPARGEKDFSFSFSNYSNQKPYFEQIKSTFTS